MKWPRYINIALRLAELGGKRSEAVKQVAAEFGVSVPTVWRDLARAQREAARLEQEQVSYQHNPNPDWGAIYKKLECDKYFWWRTIKK